MGEGKEAGRTKGRKKQREEKSEGKGEVDVRAVVGVFESEEDGQDDPQDLDYAVDTAQEGSLFCCEAEGFCISSVRTDRCERGNRPRIRAIILKLEFETLLTAA